MKLTWLILVLAFLGFRLTKNLFVMPQSQKIEGEIGDICPSVEELNKVNQKINPILDELRKAEFFRIFKVNLENECPFWQAEGTGITNKGVVDEGEQDEVPREFQFCNQTFDVDRQLEKSEMTMINSFLPTQDENEWMKIEEKDEEAIFVNLMKRHAWTFYNGSHIWDAIYKENGMSITQKYQGKENDILYKLISGVHANVNMHISRYDHDLNGDPLPMNHDRYYERVGAHKERIENMYTTYALVLKAMNSLSGKVDGFSYLSENPVVDQEIKSLFNDLMEKSIKTCENPFEEENLLETWSKEEFIRNIKPVFYNITRILDGVTGEKCKLYGKLQFTGMTAVMKIMFGKGNEGVLTRNEMVGLVNLLAKLSDSLKWYQEWLEIEASKEFLHTIYKGILVFILTVIFIVFYVDNIRTAKQRREEMFSRPKEEKKEESKNDLRNSVSRKRKID